MHARCFTSLVPVDRRVREQRIKPWQSRPGPGGWLTDAGRGTDSVARSDQPLGRGAPAGAREGGPVERPQVFVKVISIHGSQLSSSPSSSQWPTIVVRSSSKTPVK
jgi:hypothetical protein